MKILDGFISGKIRLLPHLNSEANNKILLLKETLWFFFKIVKAVAPQLKLVLYHIYENCLYAVVNRSMENFVMSIGLEPLKHYVQHNINVVKYMYILVTGYEVLDNEITKVGKAFLVTLVQVGKF